MNAPTFLAGICLATFAASGLFFLKFWRASQDRFFLYFAIACWFISFERLVAFFVQGMLDSNQPPPPEGVSWVYLIRLCAFILIILAFYEKNRPRKKL
jgi:hypothetical protein